jgi:hypothetical protein
VAGTKGSGTYSTSTLTGTTFYRLIQQ